MRVDELTRTVGANTEGESRTEPRAFPNVSQLGKEEELEKEIGKEHPGSQEENWEQGLSEAKERKYCRRKPWLTVSGTGKRQKNMEIWDLTISFDRVDVVGDLDKEQH